MKCIHKMQKVNSKEHKMLRRTILIFLLFGTPCASYADTPAPTGPVLTMDHKTQSADSFNTIAFEVDNRAFGLRAARMPGARPGDTPTVERRVEQETEASSWQATGMIVASLVLVAFMARRD